MSAVQIRPWTPSPASPGFFFHLIGYPMQIDLLHTIATEVSRISEMTNDLQRIGIDHQSKSDKTVVTKADYFVQAALSERLSILTPDIPILAEETSDALAQSPSLLNQVDDMLQAHGCASSATTLLEHASHASKASRHWVLDPIDGTRGFIRGDQYAIALGLVDGAHPVASILCCPRLPQNSENGVTFLGLNSKLFTVSETNPSPMLPPPAPSVPTLTESLELGPATEQFTQMLKSEMGWNTPTLRLDSQAKYGALALGRADVYLRLPRSATAVEFSWDHAAGSHVVECAGGSVTDLDGRRLDFSQGSTLSRNRGVIATRGLCHESVLAAVRRLMESV